VRETLKGLGLGKLGSSRVLKATPEVLGMVRRVAHLVDEVKE
jgi:large subunit ribosomal protein L30